MLGPNHITRNFNETNIHDETSDKWNLQSFKLTLHTVFFVMCKYMTVNKSALFVCRHSTLIKQCLKLNYFMENLHGTAQHAKMTKTVSF